MHNQFSREIATTANTPHWLPLVREPEPWYKSRRIVIFVAVFLVCALPALIYVFNRPAVYLSYATLLTVAKTAIDQSSNDADIQHVAIQKQILLGAELLAETSRRLKSGSHGGVSIDLNPDAVRQMLDVRAVAETNLIEMAAEGPDPKMLPALINTWIDVYLDARAREVSRLLGDTTQILHSELDSLSEKITIKRAELERFRRHNDIASIEREENEALARLKGLNESLNTASEEEVKAKARLDAINKAIARGQAVVPQEDTRTLSLLESRAQELREELGDLNRRYTQEFLNLSPTLKVIPEQLALLEAEIKRMRQQGQAVVLSDAEQEYAAARQAAREIRAQLDAHKAKASEFSSRFVEHEALRNDLEGLESLYREGQGRLAQIEARYSGKYPQVDVIERAFLPGAPIGPNYWRDAVIAVAGSMLFSLFCVWLSEFLTRKTSTEPTVNLAGVPLYEPDLLPGVRGNALKPVTILPHQHAVLDSPQPLELPVETVSALFNSAGSREKLLIALLLSGPSLEEIAAIGRLDIDTGNGKLIIHGISPRTLPLSPVAQSLFTNPACQLITPSGEPLTSTDLNALLACAAHDAGLSGTDEITADALRQTYIIYLVKQGIRLAELESIMGYLPPTELSAYAAYSPPGQKRPLEEINLLYPGLQGVAL
ncbi:MAG: integrase [Nitrosomonas sp.]|nr:integrase [Nitrosomonas sp.]